MYFSSTLQIGIQEVSLSSTSSQSLLKLTSIELVMPSNSLILCLPLLLPPSTFPSIRIFSNESILRIRWPKYWSFSFSISTSNEYSGLISFRSERFDLLAVQGTLKESSPIPQFKSINSSALSFLYGPTLTSIRVLCLVTQSCLTLCNRMDCSPPCSSVHGDSPGKNTGVGCHALLQGIFLTQGLNPHPYMTTGKNHSFD